MDSAAGSLATDRPAEPRRYWQIPTFLLGLAALFAAYKFVPLPAFGTATSADDSVAELTAALERKSLDAAAIEPILRKLTASNPSDTAANFAIGSGYVALADLAPGENADYWHAAATAFEKCDPSKLEKSKAEFAFRSALAKAAIGAGSPVELLPVLGAPPPGEQRTEAFRIIAETALRMTPPDRKTAKEFYAKYLGGPNRGSPASTAKSKFALAKLHLADKETDKARVWLADIGTNAPAEMQARAKVQLGQIAMAEQRWPDAIVQFESALGSSGLPTEDRGTTRFLVGLAHLKAGNDASAAPFLLQAAKEPGAIGSAAAMRLAEIRSRDPKARGEAADWLEKAVTQAGANGDHLKPTELRATFEEVIKATSADGDYGTALRAATAYAKIAEGDADRRLRAEIDERWANHLMKSSPTEAKAKFLDAAKEYAALAERSVDPASKSALLRKTAVQYKQADRRDKALEVVSAILVTKNLPDELTGQAWLDRADLLPPDQTAEVEEALKQAMSYPGPAATPARFKLAVGHVRRGQDLAAKAATDVEKREADATAKLGRDMLAQLADGASVPDAATHEQALFELGRLAMVDRQYPDAEARLRKQLTLYPNGEQAEKARLWMASALLARAQLDVAAATKARAEALEHLKVLAKSSDAFLRTWGEIWQANTLLQMGETDATLALCKELMVKHEGKLEELVLGKLVIHARLSAKSADAGEALKALVRMEELFAKLPKDAFRSDPEYSYEHWKAELPRLRDMLKK